MKWLPFVIPIATFVAGTFFGWNNGKKSVIAIVETEAKTLLGDAAKHVSAFWASVKAKI